MRRRALVAATIGIALVVGLAGSAEAEVPVSQVGWWTRSPSPPTVPDGGISVAAAPDGDLTIGAVVVDAAGGASGASLRMVESSGGAGTEVAGIRVCPTTATWSPVAGGAMADAPEARCDGGSVPMTRGADGTWTADVQELVDGKTGPVGLAVVPAEGSVAFQLNFAPPAVDGSVSDGAATEFSPATTTAPSTSNAGSFTSPSTPSFVAPVSPQPAELAPAQPGAAAPSDGSSATAEAVEFVPEIGAGVPAGGGEANVSRATVVLWYVLAMVVGGAVAGLSWLRSTGQLSPAALLARTRRS